MTKRVTFCFNATVARKKWLIKNAGVKNEGSDINVGKCRRVVYRKLRK